MSAPAPPFAPEDDEPWLIELQAHLRLNRRTALRLSGLILLAFLLAGAILPARYTATASLAVLPSPEFTVRQDAGSHAFSSAAFALDEIMTAETAILESDALHADTLDAIGAARIYPALDEGAAPGLAARIVHGVFAVALAPWRSPPANQAGARRDEALRRFAADFHVRPTKNSNVITLKFTNRDAGMAARAINTLLAAYAQRRHALYEDPQLDIVRRQTETRAAAVRDADAALAAYKTRHGIADIATERDLLLRRQSDTRTALGAAEAAQAEQAARLRAVSGQIAQLPATIPLYNETDADTRVQALDAALAELRGRIAQASGQYRDHSRRMTALRSELIAREAERRQMLANPAPSQIRQGRAPSLDPLLLDRAHAVADEAASGARAAALRHALAEETAALSTLTQEETDLAALARRKQAAEESFAAASRAQNEQRLTEAEDALRLANIRVIEPARAPQHPVPLPLYCTIAGVFFAGVGGMIYLFVKFTWNGKILTPEGLAAVTGLPVFGVMYTGMDFADDISAAE